MKDKRIFRIIGFICIIPAFFCYMGLVIFGINGLQTESTGLDIEKLSWVFIIGGFLMIVYIFQYGIFVLTNNDWWKAKELLDEEQIAYHKARLKYDQALRKFGRKFLEEEEG